MFLSLTRVSMMQVNEDLVKGEPWPDFLGPQWIRSNSKSFCVVLPICFNPTAAGPSLQMRGQPGLPGQLICIVCGFMCLTETTLLICDTNQHHKLVACLCMGFNEWILMCVFSYGVGDMIQWNIYHRSQPRNSGISVGKCAYWDMLNLYIVKNIYCEIELGGH